MMASLGKNELVTLLFFGLSNAAITSLGKKLVILLILSVWHSDHLVEKEGADYLAFLFLHMA